MQPAKDRKDIPLGPLTCAVDNSIIYLYAVSR